MPAFLWSSASAFATSLIQFALGCVLAIPLYRSPLAARIRAGLRDESGLASLAAVLAAAACGSILPLGPWGAVPIAAAALAAGLGPELLVSFLCANVLFDSLVPFTDPTFIWRTGYGRVLLALLAGTLAGLLAARGRASGKGLFRARLLPRPVGEALGAGTARRFTPASFGLALALAFIALGALADTAFRRYGLSAIVAFLFTSPATSFLPAFFAARNVVNPFFLLAMRILAALTDFSVLAALALIARPKGFLWYLAYFAALAAILSVSAFF